MAFVDVVRTDYPKKIFRNKRTGKETIREAFYCCSYRYQGREIANYNSEEDIIRLNSEYIDSKVSNARMKERSEYFKKPAYERALECDYKEAYKYLFAMLGIDETTKMSEFMNIYF